MTINIKNLVSNWESYGYDYDTIYDEFSSLRCGIWAFYENGLITKEKLQAEHRKLNKAIDIMAKKFNQ